MKEGEEGEGDIERERQRENGGKKPRGRFGIHSLLLESMPTWQSLSYFSDSMN